LQDELRAGASEKWKMAYAFDGRALGQVLVDTERLAEQTREHERRLSLLVTRIEDADERGEVLDEVRQLCVRTRDQRMQLEAMLARLLGAPIEADTLQAQRPRILIADDSANHRDGSARVLEDSGFAAITVANGLEALMVAHYAKPSVVIMSVNMPVLDGIEAARLLKASPGTRHVRVIAHTAWPSFYDGPLKTVFDGVLAKPSAPEALIASVRRFVVPDDEAQAAGL
jgi:CheY-like chemotaxis protein